MINKITKNLIILGAIVISLASANNAFAYCVGYSCDTDLNRPYYSSSNQSYYPTYPQNDYYQPTGYSSSYYSNYVQPTGYTYNSNNNNNNVYNPSPVIIPAPVPTQVATAPSVVNNYYYPTTYTAPKAATTTSTNTTSTQKTTTDNNTVTPTTNTTNGTSYDNTSSGNGLGASAYNSYGQATDNGITALSLRGSGSFMPSSIWQWIFVIILILAIIIIARMLTRKPNLIVQEAHSAHAH